MAEVILQQCIIQTMIPLKGTPIVCHSEQRIHDVLEELSSQNLTSVPVLDLKTKKPLGFVDLLDIVHFILNSKIPNIRRFFLESNDLPILSRRVESKNSEYLEEKIQLVLDSSSRNPFFPLSIRSTLLDAANLCKQGIHRIPILNEDGEIISIISQSDIVCYLYENRIHLENKWKKTVKDFAAHFIHKIVCTNENSNVLDSYRLLFSKGVNAVAITDQQGKLIGNLSPSDLKELCSQNQSLDALLKPVYQFTQNYQTKQKGFLLFVKEDDTIEKVVELIIQFCTHRIWIVDPDMKPIGIISLTDLIWITIGTQQL